jgi:hypothetical protein
MQMRSSRRALSKANPNSNSAISRTLHHVTYASSSNGNGSEPRIELKNGHVTSGPDLSVTVNGLHLPNPFIIGRYAASDIVDYMIGSRSLFGTRLTLDLLSFSGPPGTNYQVMKKVRPVLHLHGRVPLCILKVFEEP